MKKFILGVLAGILLYSAYNHDWKGQKVNKRLNGLDSIYLSRSMNWYTVKGIDTKSKLEYEERFHIFFCDEPKIYHDVLSTDAQYVTWKQDKLFYYSIEAHVK